MMSTLTYKEAVSLAAIALIAIGLLSGSAIAPVHNRQPPTVSPNVTHVGLSTHAIVVEPETGALWLEPIAPVSTRRDRE